MTEQSSSQEVVDINGSSFNLTTALMLLVMLLVVIVALLTYMLFEANGGTLDPNDRDAFLRCIPVTPTPSPAQAGSLNIELLPQ
ncbi:hypothetical protein GW793_02485 [bacterium]|uniref:Uncharacterized protein n=2 Tax=Katanobacteria TaxID=422282 RepID=A0A2M7X5B2_UNCKA|nr:hypothetical protein [bacterium]PIP56541.1 MAG: hypothetical protein COX05_02405 [candidate division WWE3 bacterium CG22_combo_CG10-13_8_21_14_all_39_12]PJA41338.1 MAG: hypothetical protein CO179_00160 [candidate division WWE3 bacterium CG_4_9_14_3_um_filter_39_7]